LDKQTSFVFVGQTSTFDLLFTTIKAHYECVSIAVDDRIFYYPFKCESKSTSIIKVVNVCAEHQAI